MEDMVLRQQLERILDILPDGAIIIDAAGRITFVNDVAEEIYVILEGKGIGYFGLGKPVDVCKGMYIHIPSHCEHGIENTGDEVMKVLAIMSPPNPPLPEWKSERPQD